MFFELEDVKRRHSLYYDVYNVGVWVNSPENSFRWNVTRGVLCGVAANLLAETWHNFYINWGLLLKEYQPPSNANQLYQFSKATLGMENFKRSMKTRAQYAISVGAIDWGARIAAFRWVNNGWQRLWGSFEYGFVRKVPGSLFAAIITAPIGIPLETARMAYYADKTFPKELQKGYKSYWNALFRIPFEEGPYYLFKNSSPIFFRNTLQTFSLLYSFDWMKDKLSLFTRVSEIPYFPIKLINCWLATYLALIVSYPLGVVSKDMVDLWPKPAGGECPYNGNYRAAASHIWYARSYNNYYPGMLKNYAARQGPKMFLALWFADSMGIFSYWKVDMMSGPGTNSWEDSFA